MRAFTLLLFILLSSYSYAAETIRWGVGGLVGSTATYMTFSGYFESYSFGGGFSGSQVDASNFENSGIASAAGRWSTGYGPYVTIGASYIFGWGRIAGAAYGLSGGRLTVGLESEIYRNVLAGFYISPLYLRTTSMGSTNANLIGSGDCLFGVTYLL